MKLSARNVFKGKVVEVVKGQTTARVKIDVGGTVVTASITNEAVDDLRLTVGDSAYAIVKASSVIVAKDWPPVLAHAPPQPPGQTAPVSTQALINAPNAS